MNPPDASAAAAYARTKALFDAVADLPDEAACHARLDELGATPEQLAQVLALVARDKSAVTHFSTPLASVLVGASAAELKLGDRLGPWALVGELGAGGMGQVFLAQRADGLYEQRAAIKQLRGLGGEAAQAQLARERRILATLNHPHIARLLDGGTTPMGRPYLVLEHVEGVRIDRWCAGRNVQARLAVFEQVCAAVAHAHERLVVHCDIKPGNVLVGADDRAMLLDFGIAQLQGLEGDDSSALTPRYASPEQLAGLQATVASDIYSLGRLLDELLADAPDAARRRAEWHAIVAKACATAPDDRYRSVDALQTDLHRFKAHRPLQALQSQSGYRFSKLLRRQWPLALGLAGATVLSGVFVWQLVQQRDRALQAESQAQSEKDQAQAARTQALQERDRAAAAGEEARMQRDAARASEARAQEARVNADRARAQADAARTDAQQQAATTAAVSEFMVNIFEGADPKRGGRPDISAIQLLDQGRSRVDEQLRGQPALQSTMKATLARVYDNVGQPRDAVALYQQALALEQALKPPRPLVEADLLSRQATVMAVANQHREAIAPARRALALRAARLPADSLEMADAHNTLGWVLARDNQADEARLHLERALQIRRQRQGPEHLDLAGTLHNLGMLESFLDRQPAAEVQFRAALAIKRRTLLPHHPSVLNSVQSLAATLGQQRKFDEAIPLLQDLVAARRDINGPDSVYTGYAEHELAVAERDAGLTAQALAHYQHSMQIAVKQSGPRSVSVAISLNNIAGAEDSLGDPAAEAEYRESLAIRRERLASGDVGIARAEAALGRWLLNHGRLDEAQPLLDQARNTRLARLAPEHGDRVESDLLDSHLALVQGQLPRAEALLMALESREAQLRAAPRIERLRLQGELRLAQGRAKDAVALQARALQEHLSQIGPRHPDGVRRYLALAQAQLRAGDAAAARQSLAAARPLLTGQHPASPARVWVASLERELGPNGPSNQEKP